MKDLLPIIDAWSDEGLSVARAVVVRTFGSAPLREGATMLLASDGRIAGSVSGGCVEGAAVEHMAEARAADRQRVVRFGISDERAWSVGLACGGVIDVLVQPRIPMAVLAAARAVWTAGVDDRSAGSVVVTTLPARSPGAASGSSEIGPWGPVEVPLVVAQDGRLSGSLGNASADGMLASAALGALGRGASQAIELAGGQHFLEVFPVRPRLVIVGGVPVAMSLVRLAHELGYQAIVVDGRAAFVSRERFPDVDRLVLGWLDEIADEIGLGPADAVVVLSHDPKFDEPAIREALQRGCRYVGAIGSRRTQGARRARLREQGISEADLARLHGPIGLDLGGREPGEVALAILAEIVATRHDASGRPLRDLVDDARPGDAAVGVRPTLATGDSPIIPR
jgi:xanthine dehydrogenase accessory factor